MVTADRAAFQVSRLALDLLIKAQNEARFLTTLGFTAAEAADIAAKALVRASAEAGRDIRPPAVQP